MKILILNKYQDKNFRGAETFVFEISKRLSKNHDVEVISDISYLSILRKKFDVVIPTNGRFQVILIRIISWLKGAKMIVSGQSGMGWDDKVNLLSFPDAFVALTSQAETWAKKINPIVRVVRIPNGVDLEKFNPNGPLFKLNLRHPIVLSVGAFTKQKRMDLVIKAVAGLDGPSLVIVGGGGDLKEKLKELGKKLLGNRFEILTVPFEKMPSIYRSADLFTLPSASSEAFGNVLVEAMATNLPIVATDDPKRREIVGEAGTLVDPSDINKYTEALNKALDSAWENIPRKQSEKFSWDEIANKYENLFKTLLNKK